jgi:dihydroorotate dehydrogenase electron transfer subunit
MSAIAIVEPTVVERSTPMTGAVELVLHHPEAARTVIPGQFFQLAVDAPRTLLRRPYSVAWADPVRGRIGFIFNVVGAGSAWLALRREGDVMDLLGPLGRGFEIEANGRPAICIAGGLGVATFPALVQALRACGRPVLFLQGARTASQLLPASRLDGADVLVSTDDGSAGRKGPVTELLADANLSDADLFVCGPTPMLAAVVDLARRREVALARIQVALETPMGCGVGTCLGCAAPSHGGGYVLTCHDGPCVGADRIDWARMVDAFHG